MPDVAIVSQPQYDLPTFLAVTTEMLGYSPARTADASALKGLSHLLSCLACFRDKDTPGHIKACRDVYNLLHFGILIAADEREMPQILEVVGGMPFALTATRIRGIQAILVNGTFHQWRLAVLRGCRQDQPEDVRICFDKVFLQFQNLGLADAFGKTTKKQLPDRTFYLEGPQ
jgi:hypothetical protein